MWNSILSTCIICFSLILQPGKLQQFEDNILFHSNNEDNGKPNAEKVWLFEQKEQRVLKHPKSQVVIIGNTLQLYCQFSEKAPVCIWDHDGRAILIDQYGGNIQPIGDRNNGSCSFRVQSVSYNFNGSWTCKSPETAYLKYANSNTANITIQSAILSPEPPVLTYGNSSPVWFGQPIGGSPGSRIRLTCISKRGNPVAQISWTTEKGLYQLPRPRQIIQRVNVTDAGKANKYVWTILSQIEFNLQTVPNEKIYCNAHHKAIRVHKTWVRIMTQHLTTDAQVLVDGRERHQDVFIMNSNKSTTLTCDSNGWPEPKIEWRFIEKFTGNDVIRETDSNHRNLTIASEAKNIGTYYCKAQSRQHNSTIVLSRRVAIYLPECINKTYSNT